jgi:hypothetical protein
MVKKRGPLPRPGKSTDYEIVPVTTHAARGWQALSATAKNSLAEAWDTLTADPLRDSPRMHTMRGDLQFLTHGGKSHERRQLELPGGARIWYYVEGKQVCLEQVHTRHPNETK